MAVQYAAKMGAEVTCLSTSPSKIAESKQLGAAHFLNMNDAEQKAKFANYFEMIVNTASAGEDLSKYLGFLESDGKVL